MPSRGVAFIVAAVLAWAPSVVAQRAASVDATLRRIYRDYRAAHATRDIEGLVAVDRDLRRVMAIRPFVRYGVFRPGYERLGLGPALYEAELLHYSGKVLRDAHRMDPRSAARPFTLFATVFPQGDDGWHLPDGAAARAYLREFPDGPFAVAVHVALARLNYGLFQALSATHPAAKTRLECYRPYVTAVPLATQLAAARATGLAHYRQALARRPGDERLQQELRALAAGRPEGGFYCAD